MAKGNGTVSSAQRPAKAKAHLKVAPAKVHGAVPYQPKMSHADTKRAVDRQIGKRVKLATYRASVTPLEPEERELLIDQALELLERTYTHLPLKRALHANDPIQSLRLLRLRHATLDERAFHSALMNVFLGLRDLHTNYVLPQPYARKFAFLPFRVEEFYEPGGIAKGNVKQARRYVVSWVSPVNTVSSLKAGVVVTHWNGSPMDIAVARNGDREAGSNPDARRAQGVESLTLRWLGMSLPPDEDWVDLTYTDGNKTHESRFDWEVIDAGDRWDLLSGLVASRDGASPDLGVDLNRMLVDRVRKLVFDPQAVVVEKEASRLAAKKSSKQKAQPPRAETSLFPDVFPRFGTVATPSGAFGYVRIKSFAPSSEDVDGTVAEFARILGTLPQNGLILDVRGNGGGYINIGERILQMLTPKEIEPEPFYFLATPLTLALANQDNMLAEWNEPIALAIESGGTFSQGFRLTDRALCNDVGQIYQGPVVLVTDALCYSTTDIFASGFQDHDIGPILGCHASTGAGGANVWGHDLLQRLSVKPQNPFVPLPQGAGMRVAIRRCTRVGDRAGVPVEDYGAISDERYYMTKRDVTEDNEDLIAAAAKLLKARDAQTLHLTANPAGSRERFTVDCSNIDRLDLFVLDPGQPAERRRPLGSQAVSSPSFALKLPAPVPAGGALIANGCRDEKVVVSTRLPL